MRRPVDGSQSCRPRAIFVQYPVRQALRTVCRPQAANQMRSFLPRACTWAKILLSLQVWNLFAFSEQIMRAADCKPFAQKSFALLGKNSQPPAESAGGWLYRGWGISARGMEDHPRLFFMLSGCAFCGAEPPRRQPAERRKPSSRPTGRCCSRRRS